MTGASFTCQDCGQTVEPKDAMLHNVTCSAVHSYGIQQAGAYERKVVLAPEDQPDVVAAPDVYGELIGWRAWRVKRIGSVYRLASVTQSSYIWPTDEWTIAECYGQRTCQGESSDGRCPGEGCSCGIYAARDRHHLSVDMGYARYDEHSDDRVIGEVGLVGKVIPGSQGFRAERARIVRIYVPAEKWRLGEKVAAAHKGTEYATLNTLRGDDSVTNAALEAARRRQAERGQ